MFLDQPEHCLRRMTVLDPVFAVLRINGCFSSEVPLGEDSLGRSLFGSAKSPRLLATCDVRLVRIFTLWMLNIDSRTIWGLQLVATQRCFPHLPQLSFKIILQHFLG